jgi:L,D-peptidoglycan transpeptidase YkuD (ErfK/YbiS/YcfS/YnhG family)
MIFTASSDGQLTLNGRKVPCAIGRGGMIAAADKREGDGASPIGLWPIRRFVYRADRLALPMTPLPISPIRPEDGWCDAPNDRLYNQPVTLPYPASAEHLWRADDGYDLICSLGHNDSPPVPGLGSAIFLHLTQPDRRPTEGCVALAREDMVELLALAKPGDSLAIVAD